MIFTRAALGALPCRPAANGEGCGSSLLVGSHTRANRPDGFMWYYAIQVYNPFESRGGRR